MDKKNITITVVSILAIIGFFFGAYMLTNKPEVTNYPQLKTLRTDDHIKWSKEKKHVLIEYSDIQCPACQAYSQMLKEIAKDKTITSNISFAYRHYPLDQIHLNARNGAHALEAAAKQNKFYEMHDIMFEKQNEWAESSTALPLFKTYAKSLKLNVEQFEKDLNSKEVKDKVQNDFLSGRDVNVDATPTFYLDGKKLINPQSIDEFKQILKGAIK